jgi:hypothetical protein
LPETPGINGWHWEVAFTYTDMLADICIHGNSAAIQKMALVGNNTRLLDSAHHTLATAQLPSAGLLDLSNFHAISEAYDGGRWPVITLTHKYGKNTREKNNNKIPQKNSHPFALTEYRLISHLLHISIAGLASQKCPSFRGVLISGSNL